MVFLQHPLKPWSIGGGFHADSGRTRKRGIKLLGFSVPMFQPALDNLAGCGIQHGYLLEARMEITTYNEHTRLLSSEPWSITFAKSARSRGADDVIQSINGITGKVKF